MDRGAWQPTVQQSLTHVRTHTHHVLLASVLRWPMPATGFPFAQLAFMNTPISALTLAAQSFHCLFKLVILPIMDPARLHPLGKHFEVTDTFAFLSHTSLESVMSFLFSSI